MIKRIIKQLESYFEDYKDLIENYPQRLPSEYYDMCKRAINEEAPKELNKLYQRINNEEGFKKFELVEEDYDEMLSSLKKNKEPLEKLFSKYSQQSMTRPNNSGEDVPYSRKDIKNMFSRIPNKCSKIPDILEEAKRSIKDN